MFVNYDSLIQQLVGKSVPKPLSGTLSGHAAGEPFDKFVYEEIKKQFPQNTFRQFEYLNDLYTKNPTVIGHEARQALFNSPSVLFLLSRGKNSTDKWSIENPFEEKQNDTADILVVKDDFYEIIDVKTRNISKTAQPPNIISAFKLAQVCAKILDNEEYHSFTIHYVEVDWELQDNELVCVKAYYSNLFKAKPTELYINWAAAMQIQFNVFELNQDFEGDLQVWAKQYLKHFTTQAKKRADDMIVKFVQPFEKYLD